MNRIINRIFTEHSKIMDIYCQGALRKIEEGSDTVDQPPAVVCSDQAGIQSHRLTGGESLSFHREVWRQLLPLAHLALLQIGVFGFPPFSRGIVSHHVNGLAGTPSQASLLASYRAVEPSEPATILFLGLGTLALLKRRNGHGLTS